MFLTKRSNGCCTEFKEFTAAETGIGFDKAVSSEEFKGFADFADGIFFAFGSGHDIIETHGIFGFKGVIDIG